MDVQFLLRPSNRVFSHIYICGAPSLIPSGGVRQGKTMIYGTSCMPTKFVFGLKYSRAHSRPFGMHDLPQPANSPNPKRRHPSNKAQTPTTLSHSFAKKDLPPGFSLSDAFKMLEGRASLAKASSREVRGKLHKRKRDLWGRDKGIQSSFSSVALKMLRVWGVA